MSYDRLAECLQLIEHGPPAVTPERLSRRTRFVPLAVDVVGDVAATMFVRRSVSGTPEVEDHVLERVAGEWRLLGGSGGSGDDDLLSDRPPHAELGGLLRGHGGGSTARAGRGSRRGLRPPFRYVRYGEYRAACEVDRVVVVRSRVLARRRARGRRASWSPGRGWTAAGDAYRGGIVAAVRRLVGGRPIAVPRHGNVVVAWTSRRSPWLVPLDGEGRPLAVQAAAPEWPAGHRLPMRYRASIRHPWLRRLRWLRRAHRQGTAGWAPFGAGPGRSEHAEPGDDPRRGRP